MRQKKIDRCVRVCARARHSYTNTHSPTHAYYRWKQSLEMRLAKSHRGGSLFLVSTCTFLLFVAAPVCVCVCACVCVHMCVYVCVCACVRKRQQEKERERPVALTAGPLHRAQGLEEPLLYSIAKRQCPTCGQDICPAQSQPADSGPQKVQALHL